MHVAGQSRKTSAPHAGYPDGCFVRAPTRIIRTLLVTGRLNRSVVAFRNRGAGGFERVGISKTARGKERVGGS